MQKKLLAYFGVGVTVLLLSGCAESNYNSGYNNNYNSYDNRSYNEKQVDNVISEEMNSLSDKDIAELNKLK